MACNRYITCVVPVGGSADGTWAASLIDEILPGEQLFVEAELGEVGHPLRVEDAVQVVALVLHHARVETLGLALDGLAVLVVARVAQPRVARHEAPHAGHRKTAFPALLDLARE